MPSSFTGAAWLAVRGRRMLFWWKMENRSFHIPDHKIEARLIRLQGPKADALESVLETLAQRGHHPGPEKDPLPMFLLPLAEGGLSAPQILSLVEKIPADFPKDHRQIYFDFRLDRWIRHIEPPTFREMMEEYLRHSESPEAGMAYLQKEWAAFLRSHPPG